MVITVLLQFTTHIKRITKKKDTNCVQVHRCSVQQDKCVGYTEQYQEKEVQHDTEGT